MKISELIEEVEFSKIREEVFQFTESMLNDYTNRMSDVGGKEVFDAVWGPVEFNAAEIAILDSPLLQRLRKIKQLGLASYVYCDADYSRFSHTIGVFFLRKEWRLLSVREGNLKDLILFRLLSWRLYFMIQHICISAMFLNIIFWSMRLFRDIVK